MQTFPPVMANADARHRYRDWSAPTVIVSDGAHSLPNEPISALIDWYEPHVEEWSSCALDETTLWFWCSEIGWASVHPLLAEYDWTFQGINVWDKGVATTLGKPNTTGAFPSVTEVCVQYVRDPAKAKFTTPIAVTNTWREPPVRGAARLRRASMRQKPLRLMERIIQASSEPGDTVWEPLGGPGCAVAAAYTLGRVSFYAETERDVFDLACERINAMSDAEDALREQRALFDKAMTED